jgi:hypothetical protein
VRDQGAKVGQRAAGIDKREQQRLAAELIQMDRAAILIAELEVGDRVAGRGNMVKDGRFVVRLRLSDNNNVIQENVAVGILRHEHVGGNCIARMKFTQDAGIFQLIRHRHGVHETRNGFMIDRRLARSWVGRDDLSAHFVDLECRVGGRLLFGFRACVAPGNEGGCEQAGCEESAHGKF